MAAPRSVELDQNVFFVGIDDGVEVLRHHHLHTGDAGYGEASGRFRSGARRRFHLDGSVVALWDGLRLQVTLQGAVEVGEQEPFQSLPVRPVKTTGGFSHHI